MDYDDIATALRFRRRELGLSQGETAELADVDRKTLGEFETARGSRGISLRTLLALAEVLGMDVAVTPRRTGTSRDG
jgi:transcriptional regulator with XRE-family HTH domain